MSFRREAVLRERNDYHFDYIDDSDPDNVLKERYTFGYVEEEWNNFGQFRSSCNHEVKLMVNILNAPSGINDVTEDFEE